MGVLYSLFCKETNIGGNEGRIDVEKQENDKNEECLCPTLEIPIAGNAFITSQSTENYEEITEDGLANWISEDCVCSVYFYLCDSGEFDISLRLSVPDEGESQIKVSMKCGDDHKSHSQENISYFVDITGEDSHDTPIGRFKSPCYGYVRLDLQGVSRTGEFFADVSHVLIMATSCKKMKCVNEEFSFHFGRRGPSVHLNYILENIDLSCGDSGIEYFYNEITVPEGSDAIGSYFCAIAFSSGYFGIQVNSECERRVLFSIWSTFSTDDPSKIPNGYQVKLQRKGNGVLVGEFGNEGSGGQSYLVYNWKAGQTYKFLVRGIPLDESNSEFTAWFFSPSEGIWKLIACFVQPMKSTYLSGIYSFCENFIPETGHVERMGIYGNPWARDVDGNWYEVMKAKFTGDETSKNSRCDFAGGISNGQFFLRNCGFFNGEVERNKIFIRDSINQVPQIDLSDLH